MISDMHYLRYQGSATLAFLLWAYQSYATSILLTDKRGMYRQATGSRSNETSNYQIDRNPYINQNFKNPRLRNNINKTKQYDLYDSNHQRELEHPKFNNAYEILNKFHQSRNATAKEAVNFYGEFSLEDVSAVTRSDTLECPSSNVITTRYKCQVQDKWVDCYKRHCCQGYNFVAGRCLPETVDPCSQQLCEQRCSVYFGRVICTCFSGYQFSPDNHRKGRKPVCIDIDECVENNGGCQQTCTNTQGGHICTCFDGFHLQGDNSTCQSAVDDKQSSTRVSSLHGPSSMSSGVSVAAATASASRITSNQNKEKHRPNISAASSDRTNTKNPNITIDSSAEDNKSLNIPKKCTVTPCLLLTGKVGEDFEFEGGRRHYPVSRCSASCDAVGQLKDKVKELEEKLVALSTAVRLYSFSAGPPGPDGPPGPTGEKGPRGFPGTVWGLRSNDNF